MKKERRRPEFRLCFFSGDDRFDNDLGPEIERNSHQILSTRRDQGKKARTSFGRRRPPNDPGNGKICLLEDDRLNVRIITYVRAGCRAVLAELRVLIGIPTCRIPY